MVAEFAAAVSERTGKDVARWLAERGDDPKVGGAVFSASHWLGEPESAVIVYGTAGDVAANREAAAALQTAVRVGHGNVIVPVKSDAEVNDSDLTGRHVVLVGRSSVNRVAARWGAGFPVAFGSASVTVGDETFAHEGTAVVAAGVNPLSPRYSAVIVAGLSADATYHAAARAAFPTTEVAVYPHGGKPRLLAVTPHDGMVGHPAGVKSSTR